MSDGSGDIEFRASGRIVVALWLITMAALVLVVLILALAGYPELIGDIVGPILVPFSRGF